MAANDYYNSYSLRPDHHGPASPTNPSTSRFPQESYSSYNLHSVPSTSPHHASPQSSQSEFSYNHYRPHGEGTHGTSTPYSTSGALVSGGRNDDQPSYADNVPLRPHSSKQGAYKGYLNYGDDPAITDRRAPKRRNRGWLAKAPWVTYILTLIQVCVFIAEIAKNGVLTGSPIATKPQFNPMIGPSPYVLINMGARYVPCMRKTEQTLADITWPCPNITSANPEDPRYTCHLNNLCGFGDEAYTDKHLPHQWYRFILPIFLHAGIVHIGFNMLLQILLGGDIEREIGPIRFIIVYMSSGIFGFAFGGNYAPEGIASTGASGSLFGIIALLLLDLLYHWGERKSPWVELAWIIFEVAVCFVIGLLPGLDNFSHIGGFLMGLVLGICLLHSPEILRRRIGSDLPPYATVQHSSPGEAAGVLGFIKQPMGFFKGRKPLWWAWWLVRAAALLGVLGGFIALLDNFYKENPTKCSWCKYLSCIDIKDWCDIGNLQVQNKTTTSPNKRDFQSMAMPLNLNGFQPW